MQECSVERRCQTLLFAVQNARACADSVFMRVSGSRSLCGASAALPNACMWHVHLRARVSHVTDRSGLWLCATWKATSDPAILTVVQRRFLLGGIFFLLLLKHSLAYFFLPFLGYWSHDLRSRLVLFTGNSPWLPGCPRPFWWGRVPWAHWDVEMYREETTDGQTSSITLPFVFGLAVPE